MTFPPYITFSSFSKQQDDIQWKKRWLLDMVDVAATVLCPLDTKFQVGHSQCQIGLQLTQLPLPVTDIRVFYETWFIFTWGQIVR